MFRYIRKVMIGCLYLNLISAQFKVSERLSPYSLNRYCHRVYSQSGEDGVIAEIFRRLHIAQGFFVEFGAYDGVTLSNTRLLWEKGWSGVFIEPDGANFAHLLQNYKNAPRILCLQEFVHFKGGIYGDKTFDMLADRYFPSQEIDFLSIDIDGGDYLVLEGLLRRPKVICIEIGLHWHPLLMVRIPDKYALQNRQQPLAVMGDIAHAKGYMPVCFEGGNLFLVRNDCASAFKDIPQDTLTLWRDGWRNAPLSHEYIIQLRATDPVIRQWEGNLNELCPINKEF